MRKRLILMAAISAASIMLPGCGMLNKAKSDMMAVADEANTDISDDAADDANISEAEVSEESNEDSYFDNLDNQAYSDSDTETSIDAEGNVYHDGYVLKKVQKSQMPVQAEVGYVSDIDIYTVIGKDFEAESESVIESTEETKESKKSKKEKETTAAETTVAETTVQETTEAETIVYPNLVGQ